MQRGRMWRITAAGLVGVVAAVGLSPLLNGPLMAQDTATPTPLSIVVTVIVVPATATDTPVPTETPSPTLTPSETPGPSPTPTATPTSTPVSELSFESRDETSGEGTSGQLVFTITAGEFMIAVLLFALLSGQVIAWFLKMRGR